MRPPFELEVFAVVWLLSSQAKAWRPRLLPPRFEAAYYDHDVVDVFPIRGDKFSIRLPQGVLSTANLIGFASSGQLTFRSRPLLFFIIRTS